jgi:hypothetical protein
MSWRATSAVTDLRLYRGNPVVFSSAESFVRVAIVAISLLWPAANTLVAHVTTVKHSRVDPASGREEAPSAFHTDGHS